MLGVTVALGEALGLVVEADLDEFMVGYVAGAGAQHRVPLGAAWAVRLEAMAPARRRL
jgi:hypothetical protein